MTLSKNNYILVGIGVAVAAILGIIVAVGGIPNNISENISENPIMEQTAPVIGINQEYTITEENMAFKVTNAKIQENAQKDGESSYTPIIQYKVTRNSDADGFEAKIRQETMLHQEFINKFDQFIITTKGNRIPLNLSNSYGLEGIQMKNGESPKYFAIAKDGKDRLLLDIS